MGAHLSHIRGVQHRHFLGISFRNSLGTSLARPSWPLLGHLGSPWVPTWSPHGPHMVPKDPQKEPKMPQNQVPKSSPFSKCMGVPLPPHKRHPHDSQIDTHNHP